MNTSELARKLRMVSSVLLIALAFTDLFEFLCIRSQDRSVNHSPYTIELAAYAACVAIGIFDLASMKRLLGKPVVWWAFGALMLFAWGMFIRSLNTPAGIEQYDFVRSFGLQVNALVFMIACVLIFDDPRVLYVTKCAIAVATLLGIAVNLYEVFHPGMLSGDTSRAAGLYGNANDCGMALVFGCVLSVSVVPRFLRELFLVATLVGVAITFSREAMLAMGVVLVGTALGRSASLPRLVLWVGLGCSVFVGFRMAATLRQGQVLGTENLARLSFGVGDASANDRKRVAEKMLAQFEEAPLLGHGFGTSTYWGDMESHDLYLSFLVDYGIVGIVLIPALMFSLRRRTWEFYTFATAFCIYCLFSHYVFYDAFAVISLGIEADQAPEFTHSGSETEAGFGRSAESIAPVSRAALFPTETSTGVVDGRGV